MYTTSSVSEYHLHPTNCTVDQYHPGPRNYDSTGTPETKGPALLDSKNELDKRRRHRLIGTWIISSRLWSPMISVHMASGRESLHGSMLLMTVFSFRGKEVGVWKIMRWWTCNACRVQGLGSSCVHDTTIIPIKYTPSVHKYRMF